ncbi:MAG: hypothetical protein EA351_07160 [Gemmatimonadales bacterium]|nr:MAG: hypothetical protein EA351_07160 [Gemmatimonadales bacterium]
MRGAGPSWAGLALILLLGLSACGFGRSGPSASEQRAPCDSLAAQAIDAEDLGEARRLAARASDCYSGLQTAR